MLVSIFIPVYNGEKYLVRTFQSILSQTYTNFEIICIDDSSSDNSFEILSSYSTLDNRIKVFRKPNGGMVPKSWNFALPHMKGSHFVYMSQDDFISVDFLNELCNKAIESKADTVIADLIFYYGAGKEISKKGLNGDKSIVLTGRQAFLHSLNWDIAVCALWNAELVRKIGVDELATNSDEYATRNFLLNSNKVVFSDGIFYYGKENQDAITKKISIKLFDWCITNRRLLELLKSNNFCEQEIEKFNWQFWGNTVHFHAMLFKYKWTIEEKDIANKILKESYNAINFELIKSRKGAKGKLIKLLFSKSYVLTSFTVFISSIFRKF